MKQTDGRQLDVVDFGRLKRMVESLEKRPFNNDKTEISFEYIVGSLFPSVFQNVMDTIKDEHTKGYIEGYEARKREEI